MINYSLRTKHNDFVKNKIEENLGWFKDLVINTIENLDLSIGNNVVGSINYPSYDAEYSRGFHIYGDNTGKELYSMHANLDVSSPRIVLNINFMCDAEDDHIRRCKINKRIVRRLNSHYFHRKHIEFIKWVIYQKSNAALL